MGAIKVLVETMQAAQHKGPVGGENWSPITSRKGLQDVSKNSGKPGEYREWKTNVIGFLRSEDALFRKFLEFLETLEGEITTQVLYAFAGVDKENPDVQKRIDWYDNQLYSLLMLKTKDDALALVNSIPEEAEGKGSKAWLKVVRDQEGMNALRMTGLARRIMQPEKVKGYGDIVAAVEQWQLLVKEYEKANKGFTMPETMLINGLCHIVPVELEKEVMKLPNQEYAFVKKYVYDQVAVRKEPWFKGDKKKDFGKNHQGPADMELDLAEALDQVQKLSAAYMTHDEEAGKEEESEESEAKMELREKMSAVLYALEGYGGKGGNKGGRFPGNCHHCGKPGHRISECRLKDEEMRKRNGKGGYGKGNWGGGYQAGGYKGGQGKGYGKGEYGKGGYQGNYLPKGGGKAYGQGYKGGKNNYGGYGGKGGLNWMDNGSQDQGGGGWQNVLGGHRQLFNITSQPITPPPGLTSANPFAALTPMEELEDEFELPECHEEERTEKVEVNIVYDKKKKKMKKVLKKDWKLVEKNVLTLTAEPLEEPVNALSTTGWLHVDPKSKWRRIRSVMDSGASENCGPPELAPEIEIVESIGSRRGQKYTAAGGKTIDNLGEKTVDMVTEWGQDVVGTWQMAEVVRPLNSVMKICKQGNRVIFDEHGGVIQNKYSGEEIPFGTEGDIYTIDLWMPPPGEGGQKRGRSCEAESCWPCGGEPGFPRQGWSP